MRKTVRLGGGLKHVGTALGVALALWVAMAPSPARAEGRRVLLRNAELVITMDPKLGSGNLGTLEHGDVLYEGDHIVQVGRGIDAHGAQIIDARGRIVMPGFVDTHNHLWQSMIRGGCTDQDLIGWLGSCMAPVGSRMNAEQTYNAVRLSTLDLITTGVTTVTDWSHGFNPNFVDGNVRALTDSKLRFVYAYCFEPEREADIRRVKREVIDKNPLAHMQVCAYPVSTQDVDVLKGMERLAEQLHVDTNVHLYENIAERNDDSIQALEQAGALKPRLMVDHAIHLTDQEIDLLARRGVRVAHCPLSNMRLASGVIRMPQLMQAGIKIGLGLDGGTNDTSDVFNLMRAATGIQRATTLKATAVPTVEQVLRMATLGGAEVLGLQNEVGSLTPGKKADIIIIDPYAANFSPKVDWLSQLVFNGQPRNVETVIVGGRTLKAQGHLVGASESAAVMAAEKSREELNQP